MVGIKCPEAASCTDLCSSAIVSIMGSGKLLEDWKCGSSHRNDTAIDDPRGKFG